MIIGKDANQLNNDTKARLVNLGYSDALYDGTPIRNIVESIDLHLADFYTDITTGVSQQYLSQARGSTLDGLGFLLGVTRRTGEDDNNLQLRISQALTVSKVANLSALLDALFSLSGIRNVVVRPFAYGIGTAAFYLIGTSGIVPQSTQALALNLLQNYQASGANSIVKTPSPLIMSVQLAIASSIPNLTSIAQSAAYRYLANLSMGSTFVLSEFESAILVSSSQITDISVSAISIVDQNNVTTELLLSNYTPNFDQQIFPGIVTVTGP